MKQIRDRDGDEPPVVLNEETVENPEHVIPAVRAWCPSFFFYI